MSNDNAHYNYLLREKMSQFISYAQNFEDVMLWRALKHIEKGFYVDVGANDPKFDSVTQAFYERGWRGINIEPMPSYYSALCEERPEDVNLPYAIGNSVGELTLYEVLETGISSIIPTSVYNNKYLAGRTVIERKVPATTLDEIFANHVSSEIHFLKIDVEGYEKKVVEGLTLTKWRPWILVIEATLPNSVVLNEDFPDEILTTSGYSFVYFDGLNRFYLANEHAELRNAFSTPPNVFDEFVRNDQLKLQNEVDSLRSRLEKEYQNIDAVNKELDQARSETITLHGELQQAQTENEILLSKMYVAQTKIADLRAEIIQSRNKREELEVALNSSLIETDNIRKEYTNILYSQSYRITAPLRTLLVLAHRVKSRLWLVFKKSQERGLSTEIMAVESVENHLSEDQRYYKALFTHKQVKIDNSKDKVG